MDNAVVAIKYKKGISYINLILKQQSLLVQKELPDHAFMKKHSDQVISKSALGSLAKAACDTCQDLSLLFENDRYPLLGDFINRFLLEIFVSFTLIKLMPELIKKGYKDVASYPFYKKFKSLYGSLTKEKITFLLVRELVIYDLIKFISDSYRANNLENEITNNEIGVPAEFGGNSTLRLKSQ